MKIRERGYPLLHAALMSAAAQEYDPEPDDVPENGIDVPPDVAKAVEAEHQRFAGFQPASATTEFWARTFKHTQTLLAQR